MAGRPKGSKRIYLVETEVGAIEDVYGTGTSFNIYKRLSNSRDSLGQYKFYKSCYKLDTAHKHLNNI